MASEPDWLTRRLILIDRLSLSLNVQPHGTTTESPPPGWVVALMRLCDQSYKIYLDDEYGDLAQRYLPLSLEVLLRTCLDYQDFDTGVKWGRANGVSSSMFDVNSIWNAGVRVAETILTEAVGVKDQISDLDWQLNSGLAFELRNKNVDGISR